MSQMMLQKNMSWICNVFYLKWAFVGLSFFSTPDALDCQIVIAFPFFCIFERLCRSNFQIEHIHDFFHQDNSTKISIFGIYSIWNGCCWWNILYLKILPALVKFWEPKKKSFFFDGFWQFFQITTKPKVATTSSRRPQGPLTWIVQAPTSIRNGSGRPPNLQFLFEKMVNMFYLGCLKYIFIQYMFWRNVSMNVCDIVIYIYIHNIYIYVYNIYIYIYTIYIYIQYIYIYNIYIQYIYIQYIYTIYIYIQYIYIYIYMYTIYIYIYVYNIYIHNSGQLLANTSIPLKKRPGLKKTNNLNWNITDWIAGLNSLAVEIQGSSHMIVVCNHRFHPES